MNNPFDIDTLSYDLAIALAVKNSDGTAEDTVEKYFSLYPSIRKQVCSQAEKIKESYAVVAATNSKESQSVVHDGTAYSNDDYTAYLSEAVRVVLDAGYASISLIQRRLHVGYANSGRLVDEMGKMGFIEPENGAKPRKVIMSAAEINKYLENT